MGEATPHLRLQGGEHDVRLPTGFADTRGRDA